VLAASFACLMALMVISDGDGVAGESLLVDTELRLFRPWRNACGATCVYLALKELGHSPSLSSILAHVPVKEGSTLAELRNYVSTHGVKCLAIRAAGIAPVVSALKHGQCCAIVHVDQGTHFVMAKRTRSGQIVVLDGHEVLRDGMVEKLRVRFSGTALLLGDQTRLDSLSMWIRLGVLASAYASGSVAGMLLATRGGSRTRPRREEVV